MLSFPRKRESVCESRNLYRMCYPELRKIPTTPPQKIDFPQDGEFLIHIDVVCYKAV